MRFEHPGQRDSKDPRQEGDLSEREREVLALLDELGIAEHTVVFFHSDNGAALSAEQAPHLRSSGPFRGHKRSAYEGGVRARELAGLD